MLPGEIWNVVAEKMSLERYECPSERDEKLPKEI
jgi:hypothetical protein